MGLDDVEIYLDLEEFFHIPFEPGKEYDGTVGFIIQYYQKRFHVEYFQKKKVAIDQFSFQDENKITIGEYNTFAEYMGWPKAHWFRPGINPGSRTKIIQIFEKKLAEIDFTRNVSEEVKRIIKERLQYNGIILESHNLYKDLGAG